MSYTLKKQLANKSNYGSARQTSTIKYIVIHYTANDGDSDEANGKYFANNIVKASAHYFVDDNSITNSVPDNYVAWSVGGNKYSNCSTTGGGKYYGICTNTNSISIELCDTVKNGVIKPNQATIDNAIALTKELMKKYNIPQSNVIRHFDVNGKACPAYWCGNSEKEALWKNEFWNKLSSSAPIKTATTTTTIKQSQTSVNIKDYKLIFDANYYSNKYADLKRAFGNNSQALLDHFKQYGMKEGRQGIATFNVMTYKALYSDLRNAFGDDLPKYYEHYINYGYKEGRRAI